MRKCNHVRPDSQLVERRVVNVVRGVEAHCAGEESPGAECAAGQPGYVRGLLERRVAGGGVVEARGVAQGGVGLD
jgi:hypothetical protein